jgi:hypothetical protein
MALSSTPSKLTQAIQPFDKQVYKNDDPLPLQPTTWVISGKKGSGKTTVLLNALSRKASPWNKYFDKIWLVSCSSQDPKLKPLVEELTEDGQFFDTYSDETIQSIMDDAKSTLEDEPKAQFLLILDDCIAWLPKEREFRPVNSLFTNARHLHMSIIVTTQKYNRLSTLVRSNMDLLSFFGSHSKQEIDTMVHDLSVDEKELKKILDFAIQEPHDFLHANLTGARPVFFRRFDKINFQPQ